MASTNVCSACGSNCTVMATCFALVPRSHCDSIKCWRCRQQDGSCCTSCSRHVCKNLHFLSVCGNEMCRARTCGNCFKDCRECGRLYCKKCVTTCESCKQSVCQQCYMIDCYNCSDLLCRHCAKCCNRCSRVCCEENDCTYRIGPNTFLCKKCFSQCF